MAERDAPRENAPEPLVDRAWIIRLLAGVVRWLCTIFAVVLALHVLLTISGANPDNGLSRWIAEGSDVLVFVFKDLFTPDNPKVRVALNYGLAALGWAVLGAVLNGVLRRFA